MYTVKRVFFAGFFFRGFAHFSFRSFLISRPDVFTKNWNAIPRNPKWAFAYFLDLEVHKWLGVHMSIVLICFFRLRVLVFENHMYFHFVFFNSRNSQYSYFRGRASDRENRKNKRPAKKTCYTVDVMENVRFIPIYN